MTTLFPENGERIAKVLARRGICSRRDAERLIAEGLVSVNGEVLTTPAFKVTADAEIRVGGRLVEAEERPRLWRYHKPAGLVTTHRDPAGRPTVFDALPADLPRVVSVGRLDLTSEGLLLLTNDGALARKLELPSTGLRRVYRARLFGRPTERDMARLTEGIKADGLFLKAAEARIDRVQGGNTWVTITLTEGKNREVRRLIEAVGGKVNRLLRTDYGPFDLGRLEPGELEEVPSKTVQSLLKDRALPANAKKNKKPKTQNAKPRTRSHADKRR